MSIWRRLATLSAELGHVRQAIYCLGCVVRRDKDDLDARYDRAMLFLHVHDTRKVRFWGGAFSTVCGCAPSLKKFPNRRLRSWAKRSPRLNTLHLFPRTYRFSPKS